MRQMEMTWQEKAAALNALAEIHIKIRKVGDWYVHQKTYIGGDGFLRGEYGNGDSPESAIEDHWYRLVDEISDGSYIVTNDTKPSRKHWRWNGFMWKELP